ncbi:hypothetical protein CAC42_194 [Sphaceloma murrayae]|uniref:BTB domain-containing protein n=1 Tax=Sphaceloma murrayae TaxID=2082308 RepID=A0A2K1QNL9_9PEZI|nr:hypothetical protein CAC42_194 [Sphaceloma murrayae]
MNSHTEDGSMIQIQFDIILVVEGKAIDAHKFILAQKSDYFHDMFARDFGVQLLEHHTDLAVKMSRALWLNSDRRFKARECRECSFVIAPGGTEVEVKDKDEDERKDWRKAQMCYNRGFEVMFTEW